MPRIAVVKYPGTNCEDETLYAVKAIAKLEASIVWHRDLRWRHWDAIIIPGGFSYGDYGRAGLIASWSKAVDEIREAIDNDIPVLGICNGFQVLVEAQILPGALLANDSGSFIAKWLWLRIHNPRGPWLAKAKDSQLVSMPIAHAEGRYYVKNPASVTKNPWIEYVENPNGSIASIAGISTKNGLVLGLMPHPERAAFPWQAPPGYNSGGRVFFESIANSLRQGW